MDEKELIQLCTELREESANVEKDAWAFVDHEKFRLRGEAIGMRRAAAKIEKLLTASQQGAALDRPTVSG